MAGNGTTTINFGAFPGSVEASADVTGQTGLVATSRLDAWVMPIATADHSADEHLIEELRVRAVFKVNGTLTVIGMIEREVIDRVSINGQGPQRRRLHGAYSVGWVWV